MQDFSSRLITWQKTHGRHDLPWQAKYNPGRDPYAIWVSEIMLQQTQVSAVIGYYQRFMQRFPTIASLAAAEQEEVMQYWSGLGYYARARNLHAAAQQIMDGHAGKFPEDFAAIQSLPGIGRSTAAAIASFAYDVRQPILDGNVKRVFTRHFLVDGWPGLPKVEKQLWDLAEQFLPQTDMVAYTQGLMDLGATLCTRSKPRCDECPLQQSCAARKNNRTHDLPASRPRKATPEKHTTMLILLRGDEVLLEKRPPSGIWGGLWSLPEIAADADPLRAVQQRFGYAAAQLAPQLAPFSHTFSHFRLQITPQPVHVRKPHQAEESGRVWLEKEEALGAALPAPVRKLLEQLVATPPLIFA